MKKTFREYSLKKINFKTLFFLIIFPLILLACKADEIEVSIKSNDLRKVISGDTVSVGFEAELNMMAENNSETKAQIRAIEKIIDKYFSNLTSRKLFYYLLQWYAKFWIKVI